MKYIHSDVAARKRPTNVTVRANVLDEAKALDLNVSEAAEAGISAAIKTAREKAWREENGAAIRAYNESIAREGLTFPILWPDD